MPRTTRATIMAATTRAVAARSELQPLPHCRALTRWLREASEHYDGPATVYLVCDVYQNMGNQWTIMQESAGLPHVPEGEPLPGDDKPFNAIGAARRLLSNARQAGFK